MSKIPLTPASLLPSRTRYSAGFLANSGLNSPVLISQYFHTAYCALPIRTEISSSVSRIYRILRLSGLVMWTTYGQICAQTMEVFRCVSTLPTISTLSSRLIRSYTQFCIQLAARQSTVSKSFFTTVISSDVHTFHLAYNYNYIYIKKGY